MLTGSTPLSPPAGGGCCAAAALAAVSPLYRRVLGWTERSTLLSAVEVGQPVTAALVVATKGGDVVVLGDAAGGLHLLTPDGARVAQYHTGAASGVASLASAPLRRHATAMVVGHAGGELSMHSILHAAPGRPGDGADRGGGGGEPIRSITPLALLPPGEVLCRGEPAGPCPAVAAVHAASWGGGLALLAVDAAGAVAQLQLHRETGAVAAVARWRGAGAVLAARQSRAVATLLGPPGAALLRSRSVRRPEGADASLLTEPLAGFEFRACAGLNGSALVAAAPDALLPSRFYGATDAGQVVVLSMTREQGCEVVSSAALPPGFLYSNSSMAMVSIPGYLLMSAGPSIAVLNTTLAGGRGRHAPEPVSQDDFSSLATRFVKQRPQSAGGSEDSSTASGEGRLLAAEPARGLVVLGFRSSVVAVYEMDLHFRRRPPPHKGVYWLQALQPIAAVGILAVVLVRVRKRRAEAGGGGGGGEGAEHIAALERLLRDPRGAGKPSWRRPAAAAGADAPANRPERSKRPGRGAGRAVRASGSQLGDWGAEEEEGDASGSDGLLDYERIRIPEPRAAAASGAAQGQAFGLGSEDELPASGDDL